MSIAVVVMVMVVLVAARGTPGLPMHHGGSSSQRINRLDDDTPEMRWSGSCSPRKALLRHYQDAVLECEMYVPAGTSLAWLKDEAQILPQVAASRHTGPEVTIASRNHRHGSRKAAPSRKGIPLLHISTGTYIDCASSIHQGNYAVRVTTPSQHVYVRNFTVILTSSVVSPAVTCFLGTKQVAQIPRIWQYARHAQGKHGRRVLLPCRVMQHGAATTTTTWYFKGKRLGSAGKGSDKYQVLPSGDLLVLRTEPRDAGLYTCTVHNTLKPYLFDRVHTWLLVHKGRAASP